MELEKIINRAEVMLKQIDERGLASIFEFYDKNDIEANYLKLKIMSQLHIYDEHGQRYGDEVIKSYVCAEKDCEKILKSQQEIKEFEFLINMDKNNKEDFYKISKYYYYERMIEFLSAINDEYILSFTKEFGAELPEKKPKLLNREAREKYKEQLEKVKFQKRQFKELKKRIATLLETIKTEYSKIDISALTLKYPQESEIIKRHVDRNAQIRLSVIEEYKKEGKVFHFIDKQSFNYEFLENLALRSIGSDIIFDAKAGLKDGEDALSLAKTVLKLYSLNKNMDIEKLIMSVRKCFLQDEYSRTRKQNFHGGGLNNADWSETLLDHKKITEKLSSLLLKIKSIEWDSLTEEEIIKTIGKISLEFVYIHPFEDGNGRTSRLLMDYLFSSNDLIPPIYSVGIESKIKYNSAIYKAIKSKDSAIFADWLIKLYNEQIKSKERTVSY